MEDAELGRAVVAYIRGAACRISRRLGRGGAHHGSDAAGRLGPLLDQLVAEAVGWLAGRSRHDLDSASGLVRDGMAGRHPELSGEAIAAPAWEFGYSHFS